jgi:hypothetical protein
LISDLDWIAAIGTISDLGERAPFELLTVAKRKYTAKYLKEATALINAIRRASVYNPEVAAQALLTHQNPKELVNSSSPEVETVAGSAGRSEAGTGGGSAGGSRFCRSGSAAAIEFTLPNSSFNRPKLEYAPAQIHCDCCK